MIKHYRDIIGTSVLRFEDGILLGRVKDVIIDPDTGRLEGFWIKPVGVLTGYTVLQAHDIVEWKKNVYVKSEAELASANEIIKIAEILSDGRQIIGNKVRTEAGEGIGRVVDIDFDNEFFYLKNLYVQKSLLGFFTYKKRVISYDLVLEVLPDYILIKELTAAKSEVIMKEKGMALES